jgi:ribonuclease HII
MPTFFHEKRHGRNQGKLICGVDEVGRGPLAGPVIAAAVILPHALPPAVMREIRDSKKMTAAQRENLFAPLTQVCFYGVGEASVEEIATLNILWASMLAMQRAVDALHASLDPVPGQTITMALIDGNRVPKRLSCPAEAIIKGDDKSLSIAAASIIAKVTRDRLMAQLAAQHPGYGWERNAGYGTPEHVSALQRLGITVWHRQGFAPVTQLARRSA